MKCLFPPIMALLIAGCTGQEHEPIPIATSASDVDSTKFQTLLDELGRSGLHPLDPSLIPLKLKKGESAYFVTKSDLLEDKTIRVARQGGTAGLSIRLMKGVSFRPGVFRTYPIVKTELKMVDHGNLVVTNHRVVFLGESKDLTISYGKLLSVSPYSDALQFHREGKVKRQFFKMSDPLTCLAHVTKAMEAEK